MKAEKMPGSPAIPSGYKHTDAGVIPDEWDLVRLGELSEFITSGSRGWARYYSSHGASFIRSQNIRAGRLDFEDSQFVTPPQGAEGDRTRVKRDDLLITITGNSVGNVAYVSGNLGEAYISQHVGLVRLSEPRGADFVCRFLSPGSPGNQQIWARQSGQSKPGLTLLDLQELCVALPPTKAERRAIAAALSDVDELIGALDKLIAKKRAIKLSAMQQLLTGKTRLPGFERDGGRFTSEMGVLPTDWESKRLGDDGLVVRVGSGITPTGGQRVYTADGRPFIRSQNVGWGYLCLDDLAHIDDSTHATFAASEIVAGDVLLNITGASIGRCAVADSRLSGGNVNQHVCEIRTVSTRLDPDFLCNLLLSDLGQRQIDSFQAGGNREGLNFGQIRSFLIPLPGIEEQRAIATVLSDMDAEIRALEQRREKTKAIKQGMMQSLLTGRVRLVSVGADPRSDKEVADD